MKYADFEQKLAELRADVVQSLLTIGWPALQAARARSRFGYSLFTANHTTASVFPLAQSDSFMLSRARMKNLFTRFLPGRYISHKTVKCYAATSDCAHVAVEFFGVERDKVELSPLGVDTDLFWPVRTPRTEPIARRCALNWELPSRKCSSSTAASSRLPRIHYCLRRRLRKWRCAGYACARYLSATARRRG